jgi:uncharacterized protein YecT (DUF1311 family)
MSIVNIDLSRFDYANESILDELYMETPIAIPDDQDFFKLELNEAYKNNTDRIERAKADEALQKANPASRDANLRDANLRDIEKKQSDVSLQGRLRAYQDNEKLEELIQELSTNDIIKISREG